MREYGPKNVHVSHSTVTLAKRADYSPCTPLVMLCTQPSEVYYFCPTTNISRSPCLYLSYLFSFFFLRCHLLRFFRSWRACDYRHDRSALATEGLYGVHSFVSQQSISNFGFLAFLPRARSSLRSRNVCGYQRDP